MRRFALIAVAATSLAGCSILEGSQPTEAQDTDAHVDSTPTSGTTGGGVTPAGQSGGSTSAGTTTEATTTAGTTTAGTTTAGTTTAGTSTAGTTTAGTTTAGTTTAGTSTGGTSTGGQTGSIPGHLSVVNGVLTDANGNALALHGVNWFGFDNGQTMTDGYYQASSFPLGGDFATVVQRMMLLGFNTVRLPFSFIDLNTAAPKAVAASCTIPSQSDIATSVTPPGQTPPANPPALPAPPARKAGMCNDYVPTDTTFNRFVWTVNFFAHNGFYVVIDNHFREDETATNNTSQWVSYWVALAKAVNADPVTANHVIIDVLNEPDNFSVKWPQLSSLYLQAMDAITAQVPHQVFIVEGTGQGALQVNWGDGFCTDPTTISSLALSDPNPFFTSLRSKPYALQVMISPHVYGPAVTTNDNDYNGAGLFNRLSTSFGYLTTKGYCIGAACQQFAVTLGEFGSFFTDSRDVATMTDLSTYLNNTGAGNDGKHNKIGNWIYWDWNPTSGDTGGLVDNNWNAILWNKITFLNGLGLTHR